MKRFREALGFGEDSIGGFGPHEGLGVIVVGMEARDFRSIGRTAREELRRRALFLIEQQGLTPQKGSFAGEGEMTP